MCNCRTNLLKKMKPKTITINIIVCLPMEEEPDCIQSMVSWDWSEVAPAQSRTELVVGVKSNDHGLPLKLQIKQTTSASGCLQQGASPGGPLCTELMLPPCPWLRPFELEWLVVCSFPHLANLRQLVEVEVVPFQL